MNAEKNLEMCENHDQEDDDKEDFFEKIGIDLALTDLDEEKGGRRKRRMRFKVKTVHSVGNRQGLETQLKAVAKMSMEVGKKKTHKMKYP